MEPERGPVAPPASCRGIWPPHPLAHKRHGDTMPGKGGRMAEPHWTSYVGMATGIIGALTGIAGGILSIYTYRRSTRLKEMELRLELQKSAAQADADLVALVELLPRANRSRRHVAAAKGLFHSGVMMTWEEEYKLAEGALNKLLASAPKPSTFAGLTLKDLEAKLAELHRLQPQIQHLMDKYKAAFAADDKDRDRIKDQIDGPNPRGTR